MTRTHRLLLAAAVAAAGAAAPALPSAALAAQSLASRVERAPAGEIRLSFAARPGVCGVGEHGIRDTRRGTWHGMVVVSGDDGSSWEADCEPGPVRVLLVKRDGAITRLRTFVGGRWRGADVTDLGTVSAPEAARWLLDLARRGGPASEDAILPATLAVSATVWPTLLRLARDASLPRDTRRAAVFWVGQAAGSAATAGLDSLVDDRDEDLEVREHAVFALSQRPRDEGVPALIRVARTSPSPSLRRKALFWLGQSEDPRALALFEEMLTGNE